MTTISFLNPYPSYTGERKTQVFPTKEAAQKMVEFYNSLGSYQARIES